MLSMQFWQKIDLQDMINFTIKYDGIYYPYRELETLSFGEVLVGTTDLEKVLMDEDMCECVSDEATVIDQQIFYYIESFQMEFSDDELLELIEKEVI